MKQTKEELELLNHTVLGMYDRDFSKPFDAKHAQKVNEVYRKFYGKDLSNI